MKYRLRDLDGALEVVTFGGIDWVRFPEGKPGKFYELDHNASLVVGSFYWCGIRDGEWVADVFNDGSCASSGSEHVPTYDELSALYRSMARTPYAKRLSDAVSDGRAVKRFALREAGIPCIPRK